MTSIISCEGKIGNTLKLVPTEPTTTRPFALREVMAFIWNIDSVISAQTPTQSGSANNAANAFIFDNSWDSGTSIATPDTTDPWWQVAFTSRYIKKIIVLGAFGTPI